MILLLLLSSVMGDTGKQTSTTLCLQEDKQWQPWENVLFISQVLNSCYYILGPDVWKWHATLCSILTYTELPVDEKWLLGKWFIKGKSMSVSLSFIPHYSKLRASLYTLNTANVWPMWESVGSSPPNYSPICPSPCQSWHICTAAYRYSEPGLYTVTPSVSSHFLTDRNFSLIPKLLLHLILFQVMFFSFHTHMCPKENLLGENRQKEEERNSSRLFPPNIRHSGYLLIPLD